MHSPHQALFTTATIGHVDLANRVALAPMTRVSATADGLPTDRIASYYRVFAEGGFALLITEGLYIDDQTSQGYLFQPGIANAAHAAGWQRVVDGVHDRGAKFFAQLMHAGSQSQGNPHTTITWGPPPYDRKASSWPCTAVRPVRGSASDDHRADRPSPRRLRQCGAKCA